MEQRNLLIAIVVSLAIIFGFQFALDNLYPDRHSTPPESASDATGVPPRPSADGAPAAAPGAGTVAAPGESRDEAMAESARVPIETPSVDGSIALTGARIDDLHLKDYRQEVDPGSPEVTLLTPSHAPHPYFVEMGWVAESGGPAVPDGDTRWQADGGELTPDSPLTLTWDNGSDLIFTRRIAIDEHYMFTITDTVENRGEAATTLFPYALVSRTNPPPVLGFFILHEGPIGVLDGTLKEIDYSDLADDGPVEFASNGGWLGITDKYWLVSVIPETDQQIKARFTHAVDGARNKYQTDFVGSGRRLDPGQRIETTTRVFAGAKEVQLLDGYAETYAIDKFDRAIDFGWFYFLTKPLFYLLIWFQQHVGNFGVSILLLTVLIKLVMFPLANKSYRSMSRMKQLQPEMLKLRERYGDDRQRLNQEMMGLYKREKVNPASGCLPIVVQIPVFFALYKVLFVTIEMRHAPGFFWIDDLSAPDPTTIFNLFGLIPWTPPELFLIGAWPLIMGISMFLQQKLNPQPPDPIQAKVFMFLPILFTFLLARFPSGLVIYWAWNNTLSIAQQWVIMRNTAKHHAKPAAAGSASAAPTPAEDADGEDEDEPVARTDDDDAADGAAPRTTKSAAGPKQRKKRRRSKR